MSNIIFKQEDEIVIESIQLERFLISEDEIFSMLNSIGDTENILLFLNEE